MNQRDFVHRRETEWRWMEETLTLNISEFRKRALRFPSAYRRIIRDLNTARSEDFDPLLAERLDRLVLEGHGRLYKVRKLKFNRLTDFIALEFPRAVRRERRLLIIFTIAFFSVSATAALFVGSNPEIMPIWFSHEVTDNLEEMYDPDSGHFLTPRDVNDDADMFGFYIYNNISIAFQSFAGGILAGIGSLLYMLYNAFFLGAVGGYLQNIGFGNTFFPFISGHAALELTAIIFSAAAGWRLGIALLRPPGRLTPKAGMKLIGKRILPRLYGSVFLLVLAAIIEAFWSSSRLSASIKYVFGAFIAVLMLTYFIQAGRASHE